MELETFSKGGENMAEGSPVMSSNQNLMGALAYLLGFVTGIALLLIEKENKFVRFHAMQSTITFGVLFILSLVPIIGLVLSPLIALVSFVLWLVLMYKAYSGEMFKLPYIGGFAEKQLEKIK